MEVKAETLRLLRDVAALYESRANSVLLSPIVLATLDGALREHVLKLITALTTEFTELFPEKALTEDGYEKLVGDEVLKYKEYLLKEFPSEMPTTAASAVGAADLQFLTPDGVNRIIDTLLKEGRIAVVGHRNGLKLYVCVDTARKEPTVVKVKENDFALVYPTSEWEAAVALSALKGNTYDHVERISERLSTSVDPKVARLAADHRDLERVLMKLVSEGRAVTQLSASGQVRFWKKPTRKFKKMRRGERKDMIVQVLDAYSSPAKHLSAGDIMGYVKQHFPEDVEKLKGGPHGSFGRALYALKEDKKLKRFHWKYVHGKKGPCEYWTSPIIIGKK